MESRVSKTDLLDTIRKNRELHRTIFLEAVDGYRKQAVKLLEDHITRIKNGSLERVYVSIPEPEDHTSDYDRVIAMIEMTEDDTITLDQTTFGQFVMDDWSWKDHFIATNSAYSATAASYKS